jgi:hypothetical protein
MNGSRSEMFWIFYVTGGVVGVLINLRFMLPNAYFDIKDSWGLWEGIKATCYHLIRIIILSCVAFFLSWISVGLLIIFYGKVKSYLDRMRR